MRIEAGWQQMIQLIRSAEQTAVKEGKTAATDSTASSTQTELPPGTTRVEISGPVMIRQLLHLAEKLMSGETALPDDMPAALKSQLETLLKQVTAQTSQLSSGLAPLIEEQRSLPQQLSRLAEQVLLAETLATVDETTAQKLFQEQPGDQNVSANPAKSANAAPTTAATTGKFDNLAPMQAPVLAKAAENTVIPAAPTGTPADQPTGLPQSAAGSTGNTPTASANGENRTTTAVIANPVAGDAALESTGGKSPEVETQAQTPAPTLNNEKAASTTPVKTDVQQPVLTETVATPQSKPATESESESVIIAPQGNAPEAPDASQKNAPSRPALTVAAEPLETMNSSETGAMSASVPEKPAEQSAASAAVGLMPQPDSKGKVVTKLPMDANVQQQAETTAVADDVLPQPAEKPFSAPVLRAFMTALSEMETFLTKQTQQNQETPQPLLQQSDPETVLAARANVLLHELRQENPAVVRYLEKTVGDLKQSLINRGATAVQAETQAWKELALAGGLMQEEPAKLQQWSGAIKEMANTWSRFAQGGMDQTSGRELQMSWMLPLMDQQQNKVRPALIQVYRDKQEARGGLENSSDTWIRVATETDNAGLVIAAFHQQNDKLDVRMSIENEDGVDVFRELLPELRQRLHEFWPESGVDVQ